MVDTSKLIGHHKNTLTPQNINDINITLNPKHIELICFDCHNREHKRYGYNLHEVLIVYGSLLSDKNTLVNQLEEYGDIILDIDKLYEAIIKNYPHQYSLTVREIADGVCLSSPATVHRYLYLLEQQGYITHANCPRTIRVIKLI